MKLEEFSKIFVNKMNNFNLCINKNQILQLYNYMNLLIKWNEKMNLTAITDPNEIITKHFIDSLAINKFIKEEGSMIDVGTGAGFPGIPIKIFRNDISLTLMDSLNKRIIFLEEVTNTLKLEKISLIHSRAEELGNNEKYRQKYDCITSRAVAPLNYLVEYMIPFAKIGGSCICMKGSNIQQELVEAEKAIIKLGGQIEKIEKIKLPETDIERNIIIIKKIKNTPKEFPRKPGIPKKQPIKN